MESGFPMMAYQRCRNPIFRSHFQFFQPLSSYFSTAPGDVVPPLPQFSLASTHGRSLILRMIFAASMLLRAILGLPCHDLLHQFAHTIEPDALNVVAPATIRDRHAVLLVGACVAVAPLIHPVLEGDIGVLGDVCVRVALQQVLTTPAVHA